MASEPKFKVGPQGMRKDISGAENSMGKGTEMGTLCGACLGEAGVASFLMHQVADSSYGSESKEGRSALRPLSPWMSG